MRFILLFLIIAVVGGYGFWLFSKEAPPSPVISSTPSPTTTSTPTATPVPEFSFPINDFEARITKKDFGTHITPATSPVQPEKFTGYHTGTDVEYQDVTTDVPVYALTNGTIQASQHVSGYGGVTVIAFTWKEVPYLALYGHLDPASLLAVGSQVKKGQVIGRLGDNKSEETDGERKHLHFGIIKGTTINWKGYVQNKSELSAWLNPHELY